MVSFNIIFAVAVYTASTFVTAAAPNAAARHHKLAFQRGENPILYKRPGSLRKRCNAPGASLTTSLGTTTTVTTNPTTSPVGAPATPTTTQAAAQTSASASGSGHLFTLINKCSNSITPIVKDTSCGYSPRCSDAGLFAAAQPPSLNIGQTHTVLVPDNWVGRIFAQNGNCGASGEGCTMLEFNLDTGSFYTPQAYDISNIQGFTQSISVQGDGCGLSVCQEASCSCDNAYPVGDMSGCGDDAPVKGCTAGNVGFTVVFCP